jgi:hypothetical protein
MTNAEKIKQVRAMVGKNADETGWSDDVLLTYLTIAGRKIINRAYPYNDTVTEVPVRYEILQCEIAIYLLNKRGAEGQTSHSENGISRSYESADVPESMLIGVTPFCGVIRDAVIDEE